MDDLSVETFSPHVGAEFLIADPPNGGPVTLTLTEIRRLGRQPAAPRVEPFSLLFCGPPGPILAQRIYRLEHPGLGALDVFLVPVGYDETGASCYEAVFN